MALRDKLNILAAAATDKANSAIETGKLTYKINVEEKKIEAFTLAIGDLLVDKLDNGETFDDEIMALYASILASRDVIAAVLGEQAAKRPPVPTCANCGAELSETARFCSDCGAKVEEPEIEVVEAEAVPPCTNCGAELEPEATFCDQCGTKVDAPAE
ncbi:MAG: zinc ribbon domain-containing protein [Ruminiclostridium sp.]|nr:zinc ribbon domain-containing protein [Ruminiclostridium sp.]